MSEEGKALYGAVRQVRNLFEEISSLLSTADSLMKEEGWGPGVNYSTAIANSSAAVYAPKKWMPYEAFRFFKNDNTPHVLAPISVILEDMNESNAICEPVIAASKFDYGNGNEVGNDWEYNFSNCHLQRPDREDDGKKRLIDPRKMTVFTDYPVEQISTLALPLIDITDANSLRDLVIRPILDDPIPE